MVDAEPYLNVRDLAKCITPAIGEDPVWVIDGLSFSVAQGEFLTIIGPSGAGKTTLLNLLAQIDVPTSGEVQFESWTMRAGDDHSAVPGCACRIGYVTQEDSLLPWRTTLENVLLPLQLQKRLTPASHEYARSLMQAVGLGGFESHYPAELSGGMYQRAALIRTLVYDPPVILMDEPFASADAETRTHLQEDLLRLWEVGRKTIIFVTHDIAEAIMLGDRVLVLTGRPARVKSEYTVGILRPRDVRGGVDDPSFAPLHRAIRADLAMA